MLPEHPSRSRRREEADLVGSHKKPAPHGGGYPLVVALLLLIALPLTAATPAARAPRDVFLFAGQSNMAGADAVIPDPPGFVSTPADKRTLFTGAPIPAGTNSHDYCPWGELQGHRCAIDRYGDKLVQGPEVGFARRLDEAGVTNIAIVAVWSNFAKTAEKWPWAEGGGINKAWLSFVDDRLAELRAKGFEPRVRGFVWHQGIDDAIHGKLAPHYQENLTALIAFLRKRFHAENAPFVLARSVDSPIAKRNTGSGPDKPMAIVRQSQAKVGETVPRAAWINVDDLPNVQQHHFSAESQLTIGRRFGDAFLRIERDTRGKD